MFLLANWLPFVMVIFGMWIPRSPVAHIVSASCILRVFSASVIVICLFLFPPTNLCKWNARVYSLYCFASFIHLLTGYIGVVKKNKQTHKHIIVLRFVQTKNHLHTQIIFAVCFDTILILCVLVKIHHIHWLVDCRKINLFNFIYCYHRIFDKLWDRNQL